MNYIAGFILIFTVLQLLVSLANLIFRQHLPKNIFNNNSLVSVLIPARNEEKNIGNLLADLGEQNYQNLEILVFDDQSTDNTAQIVDSFSEIDSRIRLIKSTGLPKGWTGKNFACYSLSQHATGKYFLFLDADVRITGDVISQTLAFSEKNGVVLLSVFPRQILKSFGEHVTVPNMNFILLSLLPLVLVLKSGFASLSAANGQFMLFKTETYKKMNPHEKMKSEKVEDIKIARQFKKEKIKVACLTGIKNISCRMYSNYYEAVNGFSKNILMFFGDSGFLAVSFWLITTFGFLAVLFTFQTATLLLYFSALTLTRIFISIASKQNIFINLILQFPQQLTMGIIIYRAIINRINKQFTWKGRNIS
jgi:glycosyltransferase involved in cell wall biosynthesis